MVKNYYIHIDQVDSEYIKMGMPNRFEGDCVCHYIRDKHELNLIPVSIHTGTIQNRIIFGSAYWVELYRTVYELYITIGVLSVWNCTEWYGSL